MSPYLQARTLEQMTGFESRTLLGREKSVDSRSTLYREPKRAKGCRGSDFWLVTLSKRSTLAIYRYLAGGSSHRVMDFRPGFFPNLKIELLSKC
jgi:hypothetical protein